MSSSSGERRVVPGEVLASLEEYIPGEGVYADEEAGLLKASVAGVVRFDSRTRVVSVVPARRPRIPGQGSSVLGLVTSVRHDLVMVEIYGQLEVQPRPRWVWEFSGKFSGALAIGNIADEFIKDINDYYRVGDVIVARTLNAGNPYHLTTKGPQYGVVLAQCSRCGGILEPVDGKTMRCPRCGMVEKRKVSSLAGSKTLYVALKRLLAVPHF